MKSLKLFIFLLFFFPFSYSYAYKNADFAKKCVDYLVNNVNSDAEFENINQKVDDFSKKHFPSVSEINWVWLDWENEGIKVLHCEINLKSYEILAVSNKKNIYDFSGQEYVKQKNSRYSFYFFDENNFQRFLLKNPIFLDKILLQGEIKAYLAAIGYDAFSYADSIDRGLVHKDKSCAGNYTLAALVENVKYYEDPYDEDIVVRFIFLPVVRYTPPGINGGGEDFYFYEDDETLLKTFKRFCLKTKDNFIKRRVVNQINTFNECLKKSSFPANKEFYKKISNIVKDYYKAVNFTFVEEEMSDILGKVIKRYLYSNGICSFQELKKNKSILLQIANKFFILGTTYYYRNWVDISQGLDEIKERLKSKSPVKVKVFACSTGEEVITYALTFLEMGIKDFYLLGSDINPNYIKKAASFRYLEERIDRLPDDKKRLIYKYFKKDEDGYLVPKDLEFFKRHIKYFVQDITKPLPKLKGYFAPPYDIVNIQNVLNYIDSKEVFKNLEYWLALVDKGGLLVLRDRLYKPSFFLKSSLYTKFVIINDSCAVKLFSKDNVSGLIKVYEKRIKEKHRFYDYIMLANILEMRKEWDKCYSLLEEALVYYKYSYEVLSKMGYIAYRAGKTELAEGYLKEAYDIFPVSIKILKILSNIYKAKRQKDKARYYKSLAEANKYYIVNQTGGDPDEKIKRYRKVAQMKSSDSMVYLSMAFVSLNIAEDFLKKDKKEDAQSFCWDAVENLSKIKDAENNPFYTLLKARAFMYIAKIFTEKGSIKQAEKYINKAVENFEKSLRKKHFIVFYDYGKLYLIWGDLLNNKGNIFSAIEKYEKAVRYFKESDKHLFEKRSYYLYYLYVDLAQALFNLSKIRENKDKARKDAAQAYVYLNKALLVKAVYGAKANNLRKKIKEYYPNLELWLE